MSDNDNYNIIVVYTKASLYTSNTWTLSYKASLLVVKTTKVTYSI